MARVLLIQAAVHRVHVERAHPLGLMCLAAHLRRSRGDQVVIHDMRLAWKDFAAPLARARAFRPDVVGISAHGIDAPAMHRLAAEIKREFPSLPVVCGGVHGTAYAAEVLADRNIDHVVVGEGERTFAELVGAIETGRPVSEVPGLAFRTNGAAALSPPRAPEPDLDVFPFPGWDLVDIAAYGRFPRIGIFFRHPRYMVVETARGCPFHCAWCLRSMGGRFRPHSPEYVVSMIEALAKDHGVRDILIVDDLFNLDAQRADAIFELLLARGLRADLLTPQTLALMRRAGVYRIMIAVETASPRLQKEMGKNLDLVKTAQIIRAASRLGISTHGNFIIGLPTETVPEMRETIAYAARSNLDTFGLYRAIPFKGTTLYEMARRAGVPVPEGEAVFSFWDLTSNISPIPLARLNRARRLAYVRFYLRPARVWRLVARTPNRARLLPFLVRFFFKKLFTE